MNYDDCTYVLLYGIRLLQEFIINEDCSRKKLLYYGLSVIHRLL